MIHDIRMNLNQGVNSFLNFVQPLLILLLPLSLNFGVHFACDALGCNNWYSLFGHNIVCNGCIDAKKILKDHQITIYFSVGTYMINSIHKYIQGNIENVRLQ